MPQVHNRIMALCKSLTTSDAPMFACANLGPAVRYPTP